MGLLEKIRMIYGQKRQQGCLLAVEAAGGYIRAAAVRRGSCHLLFAETYEGEDAAAKLQVKLRKWQAMLEAAEVIFLLPPESVRTCRFALPDMTEKEREQAVPWEIMQRLGWDEENFYYGWSPAGRQEILAAAASKDVIGRLLAAAGDMQAACAAAVVPLCTEEEIMRLEPESSFFAFPEDDDFRHRYGVCLDAALGCCLNRAPLLFRIPAQKGRAAGRKAALACLYGAALVIGAALLLSVRTAALSYREGQMLAEAEKTLAGMTVWQQRSRLAADMDAEIRRLTEKTAELRQTQQDWAAAAGSMGRLLPRECWLERLDFDGSNGLTLQGGALTEADLEKMQENIKKSGLYGKAELLSAESRQNASGTGYMLCRLRLQPLKEKNNE